MPVIASKVRALRISDRVLTLGKQFGTGVILATGFIHMMPTAMANLSSPCLGPTFSENYTAFGGLFILLSSLFMHWIEFIAVEHNERRMREAAASQGLKEINIDLGGLGATGVAAAPCPGHSVTIVEERPCHDSCSSVTSCDSVHTPQEDVSGVKSSGSSITKTLSNHHHDQKHDHAHRHDHDTKHASGHSHQDKSHHHHTQEVGHSHAHGLSLLDESQRRISTYILEAGIAAHSVIIGVSLGVSTGSEFTGLLIALVFHQFFEGKAVAPAIYLCYITDQFLFVGVQVDDWSRFGWRRISSTLAFFLMILGFALGARIADLAFDTTYTHYVLALIFSLTTPTGVAIGIGISSSYSANSKSSLLVEGIFDSISTGILLYMGYVNLLAIEFNLNGEIRKQSKKIKSLCFLALWAGAAVMAIIGRFA